MEIPQQVHAVKDDATARLLGIPGVHAVGIGAKQVGGKRTDEIGILAFVVRKKSPAEIPDEEVIPPQFGGIKTDVIQMSQPHYLNANPNSLTVNVTPKVPAGSGATVTLAGNDPPEEGLVVVVCVTVQRPGRSTLKLFSNAITDGKVTLVQVASRLTGLDPDAVTATALSGQPKLAVDANVGFTVLVGGYVLAMDSTKYLDDFLRGGARIQGGGSKEVGTLGCIATTPSTAADPSGKVVALTAAHVVHDRRRGPIHLNGIRSGTTVTFQLFQSATIPPKTLVFIAFFRGLDVFADALYVTQAGDTTTDVAKNVAAAVNAAAIPPVSATQSGQTVNILGLNTPNEYIHVETAGPPRPNKPRPRLSVFIDNAGAATNAATFAGDVDSEHNGVFFNINPGGTRGSFGTFVNPAKGANLSAVATSVAGTITAEPATVRGTINATTAAEKVTVTGAQEIECWIQKDIQVGQPDNSFGLPFLRCSSHRCGRVIDAQLDVDAAVIQLDPGLKYKPQIEGIGAVDGTLSPSLNLKVQKRGFLSGLTKGEIISIATSGYIAEKGGGVSHFYQNALLIDSTDTNPDGTVRPFLMAGDSGSAVVSLGPAPVKVVGLIVGGGDDTAGLAFPMDRIVSGFPKLNLSFALKPGQDPNVAVTVPEPAAFQALGERDRGLLAATPFSKNLAEAENEIRATPGGRELAEVLSKHLPEAVKLVNRNRRVATVWYRSGGPQILNALFRLIQFRDERLPAEVGGRPLTDSLTSIQRILIKYASADLTADLLRYAPQLLHLSELTYREMLASLQAESVA